MFAPDWIASSSTPVSAADLPGQRRDVVRRDAGCAAGRLDRLDGVGLHLARLSPRLAGLLGLEEQQAARRHRGAADGEEAGAHLRARRVQQPAGAIGAGGLVGDALEVAADGAGVAGERLAAEEANPDGDVVGHWVTPRGQRS
jgi:hypothetical protein